MLSQIHCHRHAVCCVVRGRAGKDLVLLESHWMDIASTPGIRREVGGLGHIDNSGNRHAIANGA